MPPLGDERDIPPPDSGDPQPPAGMPTIWQTIAGFFRDASKGRYEPTEADFSQWGTNIDSTYLNAIRDHIYHTWAPNWEKANPPPPDKPKPPPIDPGGGGGGATNQYPPYTTPFVPPPMLDLGGPKGLSYIPPAPSFSFRPPTMDEATNEGGYKFGFNQGLQAIDQGAAAKGVLNTGGNLKNEYNYGQNAATQQYSDVYGRGFQLAQAKFNPLMAEWGTLAAAGQHQNDLNWQHTWDPYVQHYNEWRDWTNADWSRRRDVATA